MKKPGSVLIFAKAGFLSGLLSWGVVHKEVIEEIVWFGPGIIFGIIIWFTFSIFERKQQKIGMRLLGALSWIAISTGAYYLAVKTSINSIGGGSVYLDFFVAGIIGSFVMLLGVCLLLCRLSWQQFFLIVFLGGVLGLSWFLPQFFVDQNNQVVTYSFLTLYVVWQTGMATLLGFVMSKAKSVSQMNS